MATYGVFQVGCTAAIGRKNSLSSAIAKKMRGDASMLPISDPKVEIITTTAMNDTPVCPSVARERVGGDQARVLQPVDRGDVEIGGVRRAGR